MMGMGETPMMGEANGDLAGRAQQGDTHRVGRWRRGRGFLFEDELREDLLRCLTLVEHAELRVRLLRRAERTSIFRRFDHKVAVRCCAMADAALCRAPSPFSPLRMLPTMKLAHTSLRVSRSITIAPSSFAAACSVLKSSIVLLRWRKSNAPLVISPYTASPCSSNFKSSLASPTMTHTPCAFVPSPNPSVASLATILNASSSVGCSWADGMTLKDAIWNSEQWRRPKNKTKQKSRQAVQL